MRRAWTAGQGGAPSTLVPGGAAVSTHFTLNTHTCRYLNDISVFLSNTSALEWIALICRGVGLVGGHGNKRAVGSRRPALVRVTAHTQPAQAVPAQWQGSSPLTACPPAVPGPTFASVSAIS